MEAMLPNEQPLQDIHKEWLPSIGDQLSKRLLQSQDVLLNLLGLVGLGLAIGWLSRKFKEYSYQRAKSEYDALG